MESKNELRVSIIQDGIVWESCAANLQYLDQIIISLTGKTDLIVLPEMFTTGFSMRPELFAEEINGIAQQKMQDWSSATGAAICGSLMIKDNKKFYNRFCWFDPKSNTQYYDKAHLFRMGEEQLHYEKGNSQTIIEYVGWKIAPFVCYDLRFPVWIRRKNSFNYDLLLFVANWPEKRISHWRSLLLARAIENQSVVVAVNRIGEDGNGIMHNGSSCVISAAGDIIYDAKDQAICQTISLFKSDIDKYRENFPVGLDADSFEIQTRCNANAS